MRGRVLIRTIIAIAVLAAIAKVVEALRGDPAPQFANHPSVRGGPQVVPPVPTTWCDPVAGECPEGYPVKAKLSSGIFHQPGGLSYERTNPDRCYRSAADAEADGLRAAKR